MALLNVGYWPTIYYADSYWNPSYWPSYGTVAISNLLTAGYWPTTYWMSSVWNDDYWPDYGETAPTVPTAPRIFSRRYKSIKIH